MGFKRIAAARWEGDLMAGKGVMSTPQSGLFSEQNYSFKTRFGDEKGTNPEELLAAAHAGWRGLAAGVLESTVAAMKVDPGELLVWLGPAIGPRCFEVGDEVRNAFVTDNPAAGLAFVSHEAGKWLCDIYLLARQRLQRMGIIAISGGGECTVTEADRYFSYRRDGVTGRMASLIWLESGPQGV